MEDTPEPEEHKTLENLAKSLKDNVPFILTYRRTMLKL